MSSLNNRIYDELNDWKYALTLLTEFTLAEEKKRKIVNAVLIVISLSGIAGWLRYEECKVIWSVILILAQAIRLVQNIFITSQDDIFNIKNSIAFYTYNLTDLENLYYEYHANKFSENTIESRFKNLRDKERNLFSKQSFDKIKPKDACINLSERNTDIYLKRITNNITNV